MARIPSFDQEAGIAGQFVMPRALPGIHLLKAYYELTKPGIIYGNLLTVIGGFLLAAHGSINVARFAATLAGISLVIAAGCVLNNYSDRAIDGRMARTKERPLVKGTITGRQAIIYAAVLGLLGLWLLLYVSALAATIAAMGLFFYVVVYGIVKRRSAYGAVIGSVSGAAPIVVGYTAAAGSFDVAALCLLFILVFWQLPHFYAIALYRYDEYAAANIPTWPIKRGIISTKRQIVLYAVAFTAAALLLAATGGAGKVYIGIMTILGATWITLGLGGFKAEDEKRWARKMFLFSLIVIMLFSLTIGANAFLP